MSAKKHDLDDATVQIVKRLMAMPLSITIR